MFNGPLIAYFACVCRYAFASVASENYRLKTVPFRTIVVENMVDGEPELDFLFILALPAVRRLLFNVGLDTQSHGGSR